jgi:hypothetical protein
VCPSPDYQPGDEGLLDECGVAVRSVDQVTLLPPAAELDSAAAANLALPIVETVCYDDSVLIGDAACATSADTASVITHRPILLDIRVVKSDVPDAPPDPDFDKSFTSSGFFCVQQPEEVDAFVLDTDDMFLHGMHGIQPRVMPTFDLHVPVSASTKCDHSGLLDYQVKVISTASAGQLDLNEVLVTILYDTRTNANLTVGSHLRGGLLFRNILIRPTAPQQADPLPKPALCVSRVAACDLEYYIESAPVASPLSESVVDRTERPWSPLPCTRCICAIYSLRISLADNLSGSMLFAPFRGRGILRLCLLPSLRLRTRAQTPICSKRFVRFEAIRIIWHQRLGHMRSRRVTSIYLKAKLHRVNMSTTSTRMVTHCNQGISTDFGLVAQYSQDDEPARRLSGMHVATCYVLPCDEISKTISDADLHFKALPLKLQFQLFQLKQIHALCTVSGEGDSAFVSATIAALADACTDADLFETICQIRGDKQDGAGTHELAYHIRGDAVADEQDLGSFPRRKLKQFPTWDRWLSSKWKQLDAHQEQNSFGVRCPALPEITALRSQIQVAQTYASCIELPCTCMLLVPSVAMSFIVIGAERTNTCANASSPGQPTDVRVDDTYADCDRSHHGKEVDRSVVLPVLQALREHPAAGALWEKYIPGVINLANAQTKQLGWILHCRLVRRTMGHHGPRTFRSPRAVPYRILTWEQPAVVLHLYSMTTTLSLGEGVAAQLMMGHHGPCTL